MRFTRNVSGLERLYSNMSYKRKNPKYYMDNIGPRREQSEDTKIRKDIYRIIIEMLNNNKGTIEIEIYLRELYPNYAEYIPKVVNDQYIKFNASKKKNKEDDGRSGEER